MYRSLIVEDEKSTLESILAGKSISRFGDGELRLCLRRSIPSQKTSAAIAKRLRSVLKSEVKGLLIGVPNIFPGSEIYKSRPDLRPVFLKPGFEDLYSHDKRYFSSFISRDDIINCNDSYWHRFKSIFDGRRVLVVAGVERYKSSVMFSDSLSVDFVKTPSRSAFKEYDRILGDCVDWVKSSSDTNKVVVIMAGASATLLAHDIHLTGCQAIDMGHGCSFYEKSLIK